MRMYEYEPFRFINMDLVVKVDIDVCDSINNGGKDYSARIWLNERATPIVIVDQITVQELREFLDLVTEHPTAE